MRVNNEDRVIPGDGFRSHSHRNMEIILYLKGALEQRERVRRFGNALRLRDRKIANIVQTSPDLVATGNIGRADCERHIDPGVSYDRASRLRPWRANPGRPREPCGLNVVFAAGALARWRGHCHPGELGAALRKLGFKRERRWRDASGFQALWYPTDKLSCIANRLLST
jgi:hypothetical protein